MEQDIRVDTLDGVTSITLDRQARMNALSDAMFDRLRTVFEDLRTDQATRVIVLRAAGKNFCAGGDLDDVNAILNASAEQRAADISAAATQTGKVFQAIAAVPQPIVVSIRGHAIGAGLQLALCADIAIASETARFCSPHVGLAHTADHGETYYLPRKVGPMRAAEILLFGKRIDAATAERWGLVNQVVPDGELETETDKVARSLADAPPAAVAGTKALLRQSFGNTMEEQYRAEADIVGRCAASDDFTRILQAAAAARSAR